jgi:hypothetical protein
MEAKSANKVECGRKGQKHSTNYRKEIKGKINPT